MGPLPTLSSVSVAAPAEKPAPAEKAPSAPASEAQEEFVDDFRVGERVWVNGNKPGFIQFLGETQFAPGQWAGIVLDEPIGKNDGSVAGVRYFQCGPLKGIFTRPSKLTRKLQADDEANGLQTAPACRGPSPLPAAAAAGASASSPAPPSAVPPKPSQPAAKDPPATPPSSNLTKTASESTSNLSEAGSVKKGERELRLGDRVLVSPEPFPGLREGPGPGRGSLRRGREAGSGSALDGRTASRSWRSESALLVVQFICKHDTNQTLAVSFECRMSISLHRSILVFSTSVANSIVNP